MSRKILLTGFSHYGVYYINPSMEIVQKLNGIVFNGFKVHGLVLPVSINKAPKILKDKLRILKPDIVIGLSLIHI